MRRLTGCVLVIALSAAACGSGSDSAVGIASLDESAGSAAGQTTVPEMAADPEEAMLALTECLRDQGLEVSDPEM
jgi:hypothetical protein